jgi:hypothetical protein
MGTLPNPPSDPHDMVSREPERCGRARWCDERHGHDGPCRHYLGEAHAETHRDPVHVSVAVVGTGQRHRRLELSTDAVRLTFDWPQVHYLASLFQLARQSYAS